MTQEFQDIYQVLNIPQWEILQEHLATVSNMAIVTVDYKGVPVTRHSHCRAFCQSVRNDPFLGKLCQSCDSHGGLEAVRAHEPYIYLCHFNIVDFAIPIVVDHKYVGAIMAGQVRLSDHTDHPALEKVLTFSRNSSANQHLHDHYQEYLEIPEMSYGEINRFAQMLFSLYNYIADSSVQSAHPIQRRCNRVEERGLDRGDDRLHSRKAEHHSELLRPALESLSNGAYDGSQKEMADLCHVSPSYFSRLFMKETGQSYSQYVTYAKLDRAKELLEQTSWSVAQISDDLLFSSPCYFIKVFKKIEGITPNAYRKYRCDADRILSREDDPSKAKRGS